MSKEDLNKNQQALMEFEWASAHPFLSPPMIEIIEENLALSVMVEQGGVSIAEQMKIDLSPVAQVLDEDPEENFSDLKFEEEIEPDNLGNLTAVDDQLAAAFGVVEHDQPIVNASSEANLPQLKKKKKRNLPGFFAKLKL